MSDVIWETFDRLFKMVHRQGRRLEELEQRVTELERRLQERKEQGLHEEVVGNKEIPLRSEGST